MLIRAESSESSVGFAGKEVGAMMHPKEEELKFGMVYHSLRSDPPSNILSQIRHGLPKKMLFFKCPIIHSTSHGRTT